ncbi:hypothetical protein AB6813_15530 [bacterium RCC_150]
MPATTAVQLTAWEIGLWALALVCAVAFLVHALRVGLAGANVAAGGLPDPRYGHRIDDAGAKEPDALFWNVFAGLVVIVPAVIIPALASPAVGLLMLFLGAGAGLGAYSLGRKLEWNRQNDPARRVGFAETAAHHDALLLHWQGYELDPGKGIDFPGMSDVRVPETAAMVRALREAERCRLTSGTDYAAAVAHLERTMAEAEAAAGAQLEA